MCQFLEEGFLFAGQHKLNKCIFVAIDCVAIFFVEFDYFVEDLFFPFEFHHVFLASFVYFLPIVDIEIFTLLGT